jgi:hypothetical protein
VLTVRLLLRFLWAENVLHNIIIGLTSQRSYHFFLPFSPKFPPLDILHGQEVYIVLRHRVFIRIKSLPVDMLTLLLETPGLNLSRTACYLVSVLANAGLGHDRLHPNNFSVDRYSRTIRGRNAK